MKPIAYEGDKPYIFVSYAHKDSDRVYQIINKLHEEGYRIWYDEGIPLAADYGEMLYKQIKACGVFLLFVSHNSVNSPDVQKEATHAITFGKEIIQIVFDETAELPDSLAYHLPRTTQYLSANIEINEFYRKLTAAIEGCKDVKHIDTAEPPSALLSEPSAVFVSYNSTGLEFEYTESEEGSIINRYTGHDTAISIPDTVGDCPVVAIGEKAFHDCTAASSITIPDGVKSIGFMAFYGCSNLKAIHIPETVESIGLFSFEGCCSLSEIFIPKSIRYIGEGAFAHCSNLTKINVDNANENYISVNGVLFSRDMTQLHTFPCNKKCGYEVPKSVNAINAYAFCGCHGLSEITLTAAVETIGDCTFCGCSSLTGIHNIHDIHSIGDAAFQDCSRLKKVEFPYSLTTIGSHAFEGCSSLTEIHLSSNVTSIGYSAFKGCSGLTHFKMESPSFNPPSINMSSPYAEKMCDLLGVSKLDVFRHIESDLFYGCSSLISVDLPRTVSKIDERAFKDCSSLTEITLPSGVKVINCSTFENCSSLTRIIIPDYTKSIYPCAFKGCSGLQFVYISNQVEYIGKDSFNRCSSLTEITIPRSVSAIEDNAFSGCSITVYAPHFPKYYRYNKDEGVRWVIRLL